MLTGLNEDWTQMDVSSLGGAKILLCKKSTSIKGIGGAILFTAGLFITPFYPGLGIGLMTSGGGFLADFTLDAVDETDEIRKRNINRKREGELLKEENR